MKFIFTGVDWALGTCNRYYGIQLPPEGQGLHQWYRRGIPKSLAYPTCKDACHMVCSTENYILYLLFHVAVLKISHFSVIPACELGRELLRQLNPIPIPCQDNYVAVSKVIIIILMFITYSFLGLNLTLILFFNFL